MKSRSRERGERERERLRETKREMNEREIDGADVAGPARSLHGSQDRRECFGGGALSWDLCQELSRFVRKILHLTFLFPLSHNSLFLLPLLFPFLSIIILTTLHTCPFTTITSSFPIIARVFSAFVVVFSTDWLPKTVEMPINSMLGSYAEGEGKE